MNPTVTANWAATAITKLRPRQNGRHCPVGIFKCIFLNEDIWISIKIYLEFVPEGPINNIPALVQIMAWRLPGDKPLSEPMMVSLLTHICVARPQLINRFQTSTVQLLEFGNGQVIPSHTLLGICLLIHAGFKIKKNKSSPWRKLQTYIFVILQTIVYVVF